MDVFQTGYNFSVKAIIVIYILHTLEVITNLISWPSKHKPMEPIVGKYGMNE